MPYKYARSKTASAQVLDMNDISFKAFGALQEVDEKFVGTKDYMGIAYFWDAAYKFELREASPVKRQKAHAALLKAGLQLDGESPEHEKVIAAALK